MKSTANDFIPTAPRLPFVGSLLHILCSRSDFLFNMAKRLGDLYWLELPGQRVLIVGHPTDAAQILDNRSSAFPDKGGNSGFRHLTLPFIGSGLSTWNGTDSEWHCRRRAMSNLFEPRQSPSGWGDLHTARSVSPAALLRFVQKAVIADLAQILVGYQPSPVEAETATDCLQQLSDIFWRSRFPGPHPIDGARSSRSKEQLETLVSTWVSRSEQSPLRNCLPHLSEENLRDEVLSQLLSAGTLAVCAIWGLHLLATHPDEQATARASATSNAADSQNYLSWTVKELLRLCPATYWIQRRSQEQTKLSNFTIPADTRLVVCVMRVHNHPEYWTQPEHFTPSRFDGSVSTTAWMPFGRGPRICLGRHYALGMLHNVLANVLSRYHIRETLSKKPRLLPRFSLLPHPLPQLTFDPL